MRLALAVLPLLLLAGCTVTPEEVDGAVDQASQAAESFSKSSTKAAEETKEPAPASATGSAPELLNVSSALDGLTVTWTLRANDADNDTLTWTMEFGDNATADGTFDRIAEVNESLEPTGASSLQALVNHTYALAGTYNITVVVSDGAASVNQTLELVVAEAGPAFGPVQDPIHLSGTVLCLPTIVLNGEVAGETHTFTVNPGQRTAVVTLSYDELLVEDLDLEVRDAAGKSVVSEEAGPEPPLTFELPAAGDWTALITAYSCMGELDYTVDIVFT